MKIAVFIKRTTFHKGYGGIETQNKMLCEGLVAKGHQVTMFSPQFELDITDQKEKGVDYVFIPADYRMGKFFGFFGTSDKNNWFNKSHATFKELHEQIPFDIVLSQSSAGIGIIQRKQELGIKVVSIAHGTIMGEYKTFLNERTYTFNYLVKLVKNTGFILKNFFTRQRQYLLHANHVIAVSNAVKSAIIEETFAEEKHITVVHNGITFPNVVNTSKAPNFNIVTVARLEKSKGIQVLIEAFAKLENKKIAMTVIGSGPYEEELKSLAKNLDIVFTGKLPHDEVINESARAHLFVLPTMRVEGFPMVIVEAMFAGLPVIASDIGGNSDAIEEESTGYLVAPGVAQELQDTITLIASDEDLYEKLSVNSKKKANEEFTLDVMIKQYLQVMNRLLS